MIHKIQTQNIHHFAKRESLRIVKTLGVIGVLFIGIITIPISNSFETFNYHSMLYISLLELALFTFMGFILLILYFKLIDLKTNFAENKSYEINEKFIQVRTIYRNLNPINKFSFDKIQYFLGIQLNRMVELKYLRKTVIKDNEIKFYTTDSPFMPLVVPREAEDFHKIKAQLYRSPILYKLES
jgi:hypothetical protein